MRTLLALIAFTRIAAACICGAGAFGPICQRIDEVKVLFIGKAVATNDSFDAGIRSEVWYRFTVEETFKCLDPEVKDVIVNPASRTSCQMSFAVGKRYLVLAYADAEVAHNTTPLPIVGFRRNGGPPQPTGLVVTTGGCSGTREVEQVSERDLQFVRQYRTAPGPSSIIGSMRVHADEYYWSDRYPPLAGALVTLKGGGTERTTEGGPDGRFEIPDVPPGDYSLTANASGFAASRPSYDVHVPAHGCAVTNIGMFTDGELSGKVIEQDGMPARYVNVEYRYANPKLKDTRYYRLARTNDGGEFRFVGVPPGDLLLGIHIDSAPILGEGTVPTYWPGVTERAKAQIIQMSAGEKKEDLVLKLGPLAEPRQVRIKLQWPDGRPQAGETVRAYVDDNQAESATTDRNGATKMSLLAGVAYSFSATARLDKRRQSGRGWFSTKPAILPPGTLPADISLVFDETATVWK